MVAVVFLGPQGTYSHEAALRHFHGCRDTQYIPAGSIPECFELLEKDSTYDYAVVPLENSTNGQVVFSYDLLRDRMLSAPTQGNRAMPKIQVVGEQYVTIAHCLIQAMGASAIDDAEHVVIHSHPQVWGQVAHYLDNLQKKYPNKTFAKRNTNSTSEAVEMVCNSTAASSNSTLHLAIASRTAATTHGAHILDHDINDNQGNTTRFLILQRHTNKDTQQQPQQVCLLSFTIRNHPGSLVDILMVLKNHSIDMCSIHSRPYTPQDEPRTKKWQYVFFIEYFHETTDWDHFYHQLGAQCLKWTLWGTFPRDNRYYDT